MNNSKTLLNILKGIVISMTLTCIILIIYAFLLVYTNINEITIKPVIIIVSSISILIGSSISSAKIKKNGMINGILIGITYFLIIYLISSIYNSCFYINISSIIFILCGISAGLLGGILGVNRK